MTDSPPDTARAIPLTAMLCATAGAVDAIAYLLFGQIFIANMTGNTVLFTISVVRHDWGQAGLRIGVVLVFLSGVFTTRAALIKLASGHERSIRLFVLVFEFFLLIALALIPQAYTVRVGLLVLLAFAMGMQNDAFRRIAGMRLNTTFITGDLEELGAALANREDPAKRNRARGRIAEFSTIWIAYVIGAVLGAFFAFHFGAKALWVPAALVATAAILVWIFPLPTFQQTAD